MKRETFTAGCLRVESSLDWNGRYFICCNGQASIFCRSRQEVLKFAKWPAKTPGGDGLRAWLTELEQGDAERATRKMAAEDAEQRAETIKATGFGPECHGLDETDPNYQTKMVT